MIIHTFKKLVIIVFWLANGKEMLNELHDIVSEVWVWWMQPIDSYVHRCFVVYVLRISQNVYTYV